MPQVVEAVKEGLTAWEMWLPMGAYLLIMHKTGATLEAWLEERGIPADWAPVVTDIAFAATAYAFAGALPEYRKFLDPAGHVAMGMAILHTTLIFWPEGGSPRKS